MSDSLKSLVSASIRAARRAKGMTQESLATAVGRSPEAISNVERGDSLPTLETLMAIGQALGTSPGRLLPASELEPSRSQTAVRLEQEIALILRQLDERALRIVKTQIRALLSE